MHDREIVVSIEGLHDRISAQLVFGVKTYDEDTMKILRYQAFIFIWKIICGTWEKYVSMTVGATAVPTEMVLNTMSTLMKTMQNRH